MDFACHTENGRKLNTPKFGCTFVDANDKIIFVWHSITVVEYWWHAKWCTVYYITFESKADAVRGSHVTTIDGDRFCGADDNVAGFGKVLVTGRQTHANIFFLLVCLFACMWFPLSNRFQYLSDAKMILNIQRISAES